MRCARLAAAFALAIGCSGQTPARPAPAGAHYAVATTNAAAQAAFDRGLAFLYAFNVGEARTQFKAAAADDPHCAMTYWGEAVAETIDINLPQTDDGDRRGATAIARARAQRAAATPEEQAFIDALALRYTPQRSKAQRFAAYADAMQHIATANPSDAQALTLAAYARWNTIGDLVDKQKAPVPGALEMEHDLDAALAIDPDNLGAHHLRIHTEEQLLRPERALADARFFDGLMFAPGMSHLPHMAGHIYARVGDYPALVAANQRAVANDAAYFALGTGEGQTYMQTYHDHDLDFIGYGLTTMGDDAGARAAVVHEDERMRLRVAVRTRDASALALATSAKNEAARAIVFARTGKHAEADALVAAFPAGDDDTERISHGIARAIVARSEGRLEAAAAAYRTVLTLRGTDLGDPKIAWQYPPGEGLGAVLLEQRRYADAASTFRAELVAYPNDPRLAFGLAEALHAQGLDDSAERAIVARNWHGAAPLTVAQLG